MLEDGSHQAVHLTGVTEEYLALAVLDVLLDVQGNSLRNAEILHVLGDCNAHLGTKLEEMIYSVT